MSNLAEIVTTAAGRYGDRTAIKLDTTELSYRELDRAVVVPMNVLLKEREAEFHPSDSGAVLKRAISVSQLAAGVDAGAR